MSDWVTCEKCKSPVEKDGALVRTIMIAPPIYGHSHPDCVDPWLTSDNGNRRKAMRVGIDLDGVCYDFAASVREYLCNREGTHDPEACADPERWEFYEDWGLDLPAFLDAFHAGVNAGVIFSHGAPFPNVAEAFARIKAGGHSIHIVTDRSMGNPGASEAATSAWLARHGLPFDSLTFSADKAVVNLDVMVDDKLANYDALEAAGIRAYLLTRKWNQHDLTPRRRVLDLLHFAEVICR